MGERADALACRFEARAQEVTATLERLTDADWVKKTSAEQWPVGVVAHHIAVAHKMLAGVIAAVAGGRALPDMSMDDIHAMNARHAQEHAGCTRSETVALHRHNATAAASIVRGLDDAQLERRATVLKGMPPMSAGQLIEGLLCAHPVDHLESIRATVGG